MPSVLLCGLWPPCLSNWIWWLPGFVTQRADLCKLQAGVSESAAVSVRTEFHQSSQSKQSVSVSFSSFTPSFAWTNTTHIFFRKFSDLILFPVTKTYTGSLVVLSLYTFVFESVSLLFVIRGYITQTETVRLLWNKHKHNTPSISKDAEFFKSHIGKIFFCSSSNTRCSKMH